MAATFFPVGPEKTEWLARTQRIFEENERDLDDITKGSTGDPMYLARYGVAGVQAALEMSIETAWRRNTKEEADGAFLDAVGEQVGVSRAAGEADDPEFRTRVQNRTPTVTRAAIQDAVDDIIVTGVATITENSADGFYTTENGSGDPHSFATTQDTYGHAIVTEGGASFTIRISPQGVNAAEIYLAIQQTLNRITAEGVGWRVIVA